MDKLEKILDSTIGRDNWKNTSVKYHIEAYLKEQLKELSDEIAKQQKHIDYAEKVSYQTSCDNAKLIGKNIEMQVKIDELENLLKTNSCNECGKVLESGTVFCSADCRMHYHN